MARYGYSLRRNGSRQNRPVASAYDDPGRLPDRILLYPALAYGGWASGRIGSPPRHWRDRKQYTADLCTGINTEGNQAPRHVSRTELCQSGRIDSGHGSFFHPETPAPTETCRTSARPHQPVCVFMDYPAESQRISPVDKFREIPSEDGCIAAIPAQATGFDGFFPQQHGRLLIAQLRLSDSLRRGPPAGLPTDCSSAPIF
jgi:hypothetical protein